MNTPTIAGNLRPRTRSKERGLLLDAWRRITWRQIGWTAVVGALLGPLNMTVTHAYEYALGSSWKANLGEYARNFLFFSQMQVFIFLLCIVAADRAVGRGARRVRAYGLALFTAAALYAVIDWCIRDYLMDWFATAGPGWKEVHAMWNFISALVLGGLATFVYADWQRARDSAARLHAAGLARTRAARDVLQTRLQAMQARVDPQFLFDTLAHTRRLYDVSPPRGEQVLDSLIAYLRIAMPKRLATSSTLAREIDLARCYVAIVSECGEAGVTLTVDRSEESTHILLPPLLLPPLVEHAVKCKPTVPSGQNSIAIRFAAGEGNLRLVVAHAGSAFDADAESAAIRVVRERLHQLFEGRARLNLRKASGGGTEVEMEIPDERT